MSEDNVTISLTQDEVNRLLNWYVHLENRADEQGFNITHASRALHSRIVRLAQ